MKLNLVIATFFIWSTTTFAALDDNILIHGRIHSFDKDSARVIDEHNQVFRLARSVFPKNFVFETGKVFMLEISFADFEKMEVKKYLQDKRR